MRFTLLILTALLLAPLIALTAGQVRTGTWTETWPDKDGQLQTKEVTAEVWTEAFQADLDADGQLHIPAREKPYYLDGPIVLKSGKKLIADAKAEIRLKPGSNTCMVRNEHIVGFADQPVPGDTQPDSDIAIEGGIWTTLANSVKDNHGNQRGHSSKLKPVPGTHGVILLHNVRKVSVRNVIVRQSRPFATHHGNEPGKIAELKKIEEAQIKTFADLLKAFREVTETGGSLLDHTQVLYGSCLGNANSHRNQNLPLILAGGGFKHGRHLAFDTRHYTPLANLFVSMLQSLGVETDKFSSSTGTLGGLGAA